MPAVLVVHDRTELLNQELEDGEVRGSVCGCLLRDVVRYLDSQIDIEIHRCILCFSYKLVGRFRS